MATAQQKYDEKESKYNNHMNKINHKMKKLKKHSKAWKLQRKKYSKVKNKKDKLQSGHKSENKVYRMQQYSMNTQDNLKRKNDYRKMAYLRPNAPQSNHSYVYVLLSGESPNPSTNVSTEATERGVNRTTNTQANPLSISVNGTIYNKSDGLAPVKKIVNKISRWSTNGDEMIYSGVQFYRNCIITSFTPSFQLDSNGSTNTCSFSMNLQRALFFDSDEHKSKQSVKHTGSKGTKKGTNTGKKFVVAKRGDTYARIARKKNVKLSTVKAKNTGKMFAGKHVYY